MGFIRSPAPHTPVHYSTSCLLLHSTLSRRRRRRRRSAVVGPMDGDNLLRRSQPAGPLDDGNLLAEILLRLPPQPSSLPRASLVCHRWRHLVSDNGFLRRFRLHHRRNPPLLGCFSERRLELSFMPMLEAPNRIPAGRFSLQLDDIRPAPAAQGGGLVMPDKGFSVLGCRHGLVLISIPSWNQVLIWDPVTGDQHRIALPLGFDAKKTYITGAVLRSAAGDVHHFQVVVVCNDIQHTRVVACVYSSETDEWGMGICGGHGGAEHLHNA
ncbi:uncharacterized protein [Triticum aestivum]|uniref:uncharacterized protein isoform X2 n=1 Tax=Triticum aestivum TaxID=4565 RepID=UPI001D029AEE|nr:uncharacterized protein LOC123135733 isoform X2 [Triticum aestivum]